MNSIRVLVAMRSRLVAEGLRVAADATVDLEVVAVAADGPSALYATQLHGPDVLALDEDLPGLDARAVCRRVKTIDSRHRIVVVLNPERLARLGDFVAAGADGIALTGCDTSALHRVIRLVHSGELVVPRALVRPLVECLLPASRGAAGVAWASRLSDRERQVLRLLTKGEGHRTIAADLLISPHTARTHIQNVIRKLGAHSRVEAIAVGLAHGLVD